MALSLTREGGFAGSSASVNCDGGDLLVVMVVGWRSDANSPASGTFTGSFNSVSLTEASNGTETQAGVAGTLYLRAPSQGTYTLSVGYSTGGLAPDTWEVAYAVLKGAKQATVVDASNGGGGGPGTSFSATLTSATANVWMFAAAGPQQNAEAVSLSASTNTTAIYQGTRGAGGFKHSSNPLASTGAQTMDFTLSLNRVYTWATVAVLPLLYTRRSPGFTLIQ